MVGTNLIRRILIGLTACAIIALTVKPDTVTAYDQNLIALLRAGGLVIYFRHGDTHSGIGSVARLKGCSGQRNLSDIGRKEMREVRASINVIGARSPRFFLARYAALAKLR